MLAKRAGETRTFAVYFGSSLVGDELLNGTPTVVEVSSSDLTISNVGSNGEKQWIGRYESGVDKAVTFSVSGGTAGRVYVLRITAGTDATVAQTLIQEVELRVN